MLIAAHRALRTTSRGLIVALFLLAFGRAGESRAQAVIKVSDTINVKIGVLLQAQSDDQEVSNAANNASGGYQQNLFIRRARLLVGGQVAKDVVFYFSTENANLGKSTQAVGGAQVAKAPGTGFNLLDFAGEWRIDKKFNIQFGEILAPTHREILKSSASTYLLDQSAYNLLASASLQNNAGRDTGVMFRGYLFDDRLEYRSAIFGGFRAPGVKNSPRFTERLQFNFFDTEVYNLPAYAGSNWGSKKILAIGGGYDTQNDFRYFSADMFLDFPIPVGSFTSSVQYQYANGGVTFAALPEQNTFMVEAGVFVKAAKIAPMIRYEQKTFNLTANEPKNENRFVAGINYYPFPKGENNFNIKFWWQRVGFKTGYTTNQFTMQMQVFYF